jgi:hypothetical protein
VSHSAIKSNVPFHWHFATLLFLLRFRMTTVSSNLF